MKSKLTKNLILEIAIILVSGISICLNFILFKDWRGILYYTIVSNLFVFVFYGITVIKKLKNKLNKTNTYYMLKGLLLLSILCTMFVYNFSVASSNNIYSGHPITSGTVHILIPIMVLIECLFFGNGKVLKYKYIIPWELTMIIYYLVINIYRILGGRFLEGKIYPYDIVNYDLHGTFGVTTNCLILLVSYGLLGMLIVFINSKMKQKESKGE